MAAFIYFFAETWRGGGVVRPIFVRGPATQNGAIVGKHEELALRIVVWNSASDWRSGEDKFIRNGASDWVACQCRGGGGYRLFFVVGSLANANLRRLSGIAWLSFCI